MRPPATRAADDDDRGISSHATPPSRAAYGERARRSDALGDEPMSTTWDRDAEASRTRCRL
jgi:hypothetical protein